MRKKKNPCDVNTSLCEIVDTTIQQLQIEARPGGHVGLVRNTMSDIVRSREEATRLFENIHNLLWNEAGFTPEKALDHMILFIAFRMIESQIDTLGLPRECRWTYVVNLPDEHALDEGIRSGIISFRRNDITRAFFKPHSIRSADIIRRLVAEINRLDVDYLREKDILGDVFEYMIGRGMSTMSDEGQYFTHRAICRLGRILAFEVRDGQIFREDGSLCTFCDPFCGTGGFVTEFVKGVTEKLIRLGNSVDWSVMKSSVYAQDKSESAAQNTLLNQLIATGELFDARNIREGNSYQDPLVVGSTAPFSGASFDYMMMNPPYGGDKSKGKEFKFRYFRETKGPDGKKQKVYKVNPEIQSIGIEDHDKVSAGVQLAMATLSKDGGVCAIVLPQGFFFGATKKSVELRRRLAEEYCVHYIVEIEGGAFANTGTKTAMMVFQRGVGPTKEIQFINLERESLVKAKLEDLRGKNYSFNYKQYVPQEECEIEGFEMVRLGDVCDFFGGKAIKKSDRSINGSIPYYGSNGIVGYMDTHIFDGEFLITGQDGTLGTFYRVNGKFWASNHTHVFKPKMDKDVLLPYIFYYLSSRFDAEKVRTGSCIPKITLANIKEYKIPLPSLERQKEIVRAIEVWEDFAHREEEMVKMLEEQMMFEVKEMGRGKPRVRLGDMCEICHGKRITKKEHIGEIYPVYGGGGKTFRTNAYNREGFTCKVSRFGISEHNCVQTIYDKYWLMDSGFTVNGIKNKTISPYIYYWMLMNKSLVYGCGRATAQMNMDMETFKNLQIPLPSLSEQERLQSDFDEIRHKHAKIAEYRAKAQEAIRRLIPGAESKTETPTSEDTMSSSDSVAPVESEPQNVRTLSPSLSPPAPATPPDTPSSPDFTKMKLGELKKYAREHKVKGFSTKNKAGLIELLVAHSHSSSA